MAAAPIRHAEPSRKRSKSFTRSEGAVPASKHLEIAWDYYERAMKFLSERDPYDAAEKVWAAVWHATLALAGRYLGLMSPPEGVTWREFVKNALMKAGLSEREAGEWAAFFIEVRKGLHGDVFYGRWYEEKEHKPLMEKARDYLNLIAGLVSSSGTSEA